MTNTYCYSRGYMFKHLVAMKILLFLLFFTGSSLLANDLSGQDKITLNFSRAPIESVLRTIQAQSRYSFVYQSEVIPPGIQINISTKNATIDSVMAKLFRNTPLYYKKMENNVIVILNKTQPEKREVNNQPPVTVRGSVKDRAGGMMPHVSVYVKGTQHGTMTNEKGNSHSRLTSTTASYFRSWAISPKPCSWQTAAR